MFLQKMCIPTLVHNQPYSCGFDITADYSPLLLVSFITNIIILDNISKIYLIQLVLIRPNKPFVASLGPPRGGGGLKGPNQTNNYDVCVPSLMDFWQNYQHFH